MPRIATCAALAALLLTGLAAPGPSSAREPEGASAVSSAAPAPITARKATKAKKAKKAKKSSRLEVGVQFHGLWSTYTDAERGAILDKIAAMGARWVRIDISWAMIQPTGPGFDADGWGAQQVDHVIDMASSRGLKVLGTLWLTPEWARPSAGERSAPADPADYGRAFAWAADHWRGQVAAWEVWNEPNSTDFFAGADPVTYTRLLCAAHQAVADAPGGPAAKVVYGGTMHNDTDWIRRTYDAGALGCFDVMATHPYQSPSDTSPGSGDGASMWEFKHLTEVHDLMVRYGDDSPVWATEFGWSSHPNTGTEANWERGVTARQQAAYTVQALRMLRAQSPYVKKAFVYTDRANPEEGLHQAGFGILTESLRAKPVYRALRAYLG